MVGLDEKLLRGFFMLVIGYVKYSFFTGLVLITLLPIILIITVFGLDMTVDWDSISDVRFDETDIVKFFAVLVFIYWGLESLVLYLIKRFFGKEFNISIKSRAMVMFGFATAVYLVCFGIFIFDSWQIGFYFVFGLFYLLDLFCIGMFFVFQTVQDWLSKVEFKRA